MASTGQRAVTVGANDPAGGTVAWTDPMNVVSNNDLFAEANTIGGPSQYLVCRAADLSSVPTNATIVGVTVRVRAQYSSVYGGSAYVGARLRDASGTLIGTSIGESYSGTTEAEYVHGDPANLWGAALTAAMVHSANFGVVFNVWANGIVRIDYVTIEVEYTVPSWQVVGETDEALQLEHVGAFDVETAEETDEAQALTPTRIYSAGSREETDVALALELTHAYDVGVAEETDAALAPVSTYIYPMGAAEEADVAIPRNQDPYRVERAEEADTAVTPPLGGTGGGPFVSISLRT